jgi:hypothetical protein
LVDGGDGGEGISGAAEGIGFEGEGIGVAADVDDAFDAGGGDGGALWARAVEGGV